MSSRLSLVKLRDHGLKGQNYYWVNRKQLNITLTELKAIGVKDGDGYVAAALIVPLQQANNLLREYGYKLFITDAYRPPKLYELVHKKRVAKYGAQQTNALLNMDKQPHATGYTVDVTLRSIKNGKELQLRNEDDDVKSAFINYYKNKTDERSQEYQRRQLLLRDTMKQVGFTLGSKQEFWHFEYEH